MTVPTEAAKRSSADNFRDLMLARCIAQAYQKAPEVFRDAGATASVLVDWTEYDADEGADASDSMINRYLARDYAHPLVEYKDRKFDLLKCIDMYHSAELSTLVRKYVSKHR